MRLHFIVAVILVALMLTSCATRKIAHVEVTPKLCWVVTDYSGRTATTNNYAPFVVAQGVPVTMDFAQHDFFTSPDTQKRENYFDGVLVHLTVTISNDAARVSGRFDYNGHLGVVGNYEEDDRSLYAELIRNYSTRFIGTAKLGHELCIGAGEDINNEPSVCFTFRQSTAHLSKFAFESLDGHH